MSTIQPSPVIPQFNQDPSADLDYLVDWSTWIAAETGDTIATSTWAVPTGLVGHTEGFTANKATIWLKDGVIGTNYTVVNSIVTAAGRKNDQTIRLFIQQH